MGTFSQKHFYMFIVRNNTRDFFDILLISFKFLSLIKLSTIGTIFLIAIMPNSTHVNYKFNSYKYYIRLIINNRVKNNGFFENLKHLT